MRTMQTKKQTNKQTNERVRVCVRESVSGREGERKSVCVCMRDMETSNRERENVWETKRHCVCVCV